MVPAKRNPDGYVAQRMFPEVGDPRGPRGPWVLSAFDLDRGGLYVEVFTDADVADWPDLPDPALLVDLMVDWWNRKQTAPGPVEDARVGRDMAATLDRLCVVLAAAKSGKE